ncbi:hypothetical protein GII36_02570 [Candidatus Mycosynbacter amalyticus]|uniref:Uncharacterized protein n=1 Tax=Candidatus Mycosynbacter amalyticus TaxID=2665156 RepID=A0A857MQ01_9BACT|nr:hypothetical protein [Candidatus Mycosynbacter amalyticus]QHN42730.1 hypothetical protein GII36_02570 [Candidatus Mycosynbacter amalyticus]
MTANSENFGHHTTSDLDKISDGILDAATHDTPDYETRLAAFRNRYPAIYFYLIANMHNRGETLAERSRLFHGILDVINLLETVRQVEELDRLSDLSNDEQT